MSVDWFFLRLEQGIVLGLVVTGTCLLPWGLDKHLSIFAFISTLSVSKLTFYSRIPVLGWAHRVYCSRAPHPPPGVAISKHSHILRY